MSAWAKPGVKCVCIKESYWLDPRYRGASPQFNQVYVVEEPEGNHPLIPCIKVEGITNGDCPGPFWPVVWFRPLVTLDTKIEQDVALFNHHLDNQPIQKEKTNEPA